MDMKSCISIVPMKTAEEMDGKAYVHWKSWQETYAGLMPQQYLDNITLEKCISWAHSWPQNTLVLKCAGKVIGFSCFMRASDQGFGEAAEVMALYLLGEYQGQGLGLKLMNSTMDLLAAEPEVILWVLKGNEKAIRFYQRYGFEFDETKRVMPYGTELRMVLRR